MGPACPSLPPPHPIPTPPSLRPAGIRAVATAGLVLLVLEGVDTVADVRLNGRLVGAPRNYFRRARPSTLCPPTMRLGALRVHPPVRPSTPAVGVCRLLAGCPP